MTPFVPRTPAARDLLSKSCETAKPCPVSTVKKPDWALIIKPCNDCSFAKYFLLYIMALASRLECLQVESVFRSRQSWTQTNRWFVASRSSTFQQCVEKRVQPSQSLHLDSQGSQRLQYLAG